MAVGGNRRRLGVSHCALPGSWRGRFVFGVPPAPDGPASAHATALPCALDHPLPSAKPLTTASHELLPPPPPAGLTDRLGGRLWTCAAPNRFRGPLRRPRPGTRHQPAPGPGKGSDGAAQTFAEVVEDWLVPAAAAGGGGAQPLVHQRLGTANAQMAPAATSTVPVHQPLGSANAEMTPAGAPAAAAVRTQRPAASREGKNG